MLVMHLEKSTWDPQAHFASNKLPVQTSFIPQTPIIFSYKQNLMLKHFLLINRLKRKRKHLHHWPQRNRTDIGPSGSDHGCFVCCSLTCCRLTKVVGEEKAEQAGQPAGVFVFIWVAASLSWEEMYSCQGDVCNQGMSGWSTKPAADLEMTKSPESP